MDGLNPHVECVDRWLAQAADSSGVERRVALLEQGVGAVWRRAHRTLGEITVVAVTERVLYHSSEKFPALAAARVDSEGVHFEQVDRSPPNAKTLAEALRFALIELLTVLGNLTDDILTPALHFELSHVAIGESAPPVEPRNVADGEDEGKTA